MVIDRPDLIQGSENNGTKRIRSPPALVRVMTNSFAHWCRRRLISSRKPSGREYPTLRMTTDRSNRTPTHSKRPRLTDESITLLIEPRIPTRPIPTNESKMSFHCKRLYQSYRSQPGE